MLRGGPLAEPRVIRLLNRRFVAFYFNVGRGGQGYDADAAAFIARVDGRFAGNRVPTPPVWVFSPDGRLLATLDNYLPKDQFHAGLVKVLRDNPQYATNTDEENAILANAAPDNASSTDLLAAALLLEEIGSANTRLLERVATGNDAQAARAHIELARQARLTGDSERHEKHLSAFSAMEIEKPASVSQQSFLEHGLSRLQRKSYGLAAATFRAAIRRHPDSPLSGQYRFYLGVAYFFREKTDLANYHWCWVMKNIPDDHMYMRCYLAAAREALPYPNPELGGFRSSRGMVSHALADRARDQAMGDFTRIQTQLDEAGKSHGLPHDLQNADAPDGEGDSPETPDKPDRGSSGRASGEDF